MKTVRITLLSLLVICFFSHNIKGDQEQIRIVPQYIWPLEGKTAEAGNFGVCSFRNCVRVIDFKNNCLARNIPLYAVRNSFAVSDDGKYIAASGHEKGLIMNTSEAVPKYHGKLSNSLLEFSKDSNSIFVVSLFKGLSEPNSPSVLHMDLSGEFLAAYPLLMTIPEVIERSDDGRFLKIIGMDGNSLPRVVFMCKAEQVIDLETGTSSVTRGPVSRGYPPDRVKPVYDKMPECDKDENFLYRFKSFSWNEDTGICNICDFYNVIKVWDIKEGKFLASYTNKNGEDDISNTCEVPDINEFGIERI